MLYLIGSMNDHLLSFGLAFKGIFYAFRTQLNFKVHTFFTFSVIILGWLMNISSTEWYILILTIIMVFVAEMLNTSIESVTDLVTTEHRLSAKIAKDVSAGMVLIAAIGSVIIGLMIFLPKLVELFFK